MQLSLIFDNFDLYVPDNIKPRQEKLQSIYSELENDISQESQWFTENVESYELGY